MEKRRKASLLITILLGLILISVFSSGGRFFWSQRVVIPILKPFSEPCGYGGTSGLQVDCGCSGALISEIAEGPTAYYCTGSCGECKCYTYNYSSDMKIEADCAKFSQLSWAFPLE